MANSTNDGLEEFISFGLKTCPREDCRICLENEGVLPIFGDQNKPDISLEIVTFAGIQVIKDDDFPQFICSTCFNTLENAISFRNTAKRTDALLKRRRKRLTQAIQPKSDDTIIDVEIEIPKASTIPTTTDPSMIKLQANPYDEVISHTYEIVPTIMTVHDVKPTKPKIDFVSVQVSDIITATIQQQDMSYCKTESYMNDASPSHSGNMNSGNMHLQNNHFDNENSNDHDNGSDMMLLMGPTDNMKPEYTNLENAKPPDSKPKPENFYCKYCKLNFPTSEEYEEHRSTIQHKRNYVISFLPKKKSANDKDGTGKERKSSRPKDQQCHICNELFTKIQFPRHMLNEHDVKVPPANTKRECKICNKMIDRRSMPRHIKRKHEDDGKDMEPKVKLECPICKKVFAKQYFPLHMNRHKEIENKKYVCDQCGRKFAFKSSFNTHRLVHTNEYPHKCDYCPYQGRTKGLLKIHMRTHTGDYPFKCTQCETRCLTKSNLNWHMRRHRGPIDFVCGACNRGFYSKLQLERHIAVTHYGQKNHVCSFCGSAFGYRNGLMRHLRKVHKRPKVRGVGKAKAYLLPPQEQDIIQNKLPEPQMPPPQPQPTYMVQNFVY
ncbi:hypothetical protein O0L34_g14549 [Tuta absoluta]|nr:hypothetical protein O0L34_g14549 [Tuta absoluta]